jgi:hypothetical protein
MIARHTRTLRDLDPLTPAIKTSRRVDHAAGQSHHGCRHLTSYHQASIAPPVLITAISPATARARPALSGADPECSCGRLALVIRLAAPGFRI